MMRRSERSGQQQGAMARRRGEKNAQADLLPDAGSAPSLFLLSLFIAAALSHRWPRCSPPRPPETTGTVAVRRLLQQSSRQPPSPSASLSSQRREHVLDHLLFRRPVVEQVAHHLLQGMLHVETKLRAAACGVCIKPSCQDATLGGWAEGAGAIWRRQACAFWWRTSEGRLTMAFVICSGLMPSDVR